MLRIHRLPRVALGLAVAGVVTACSGGDNNEVLGPKVTNDLFSSYVAIGNSITAGYQAGGISDATQKQSYAYLLGQQMGTRFAYPSLVNPGCPAPITNFLTQARPAGAPPCALRQQFTDVLNNVAVPGASSYDPTDADGTPFSNGLTTFILGGKSQVQRALDARPTFATVWIGNNDVLGFAVGDGRTAAPTGLAGMTSAAQFQTNYDAMINELVAGAPNVKGVLIGVVQVANAPIMFPAALMSNAAFKGGFDAVAGTPTTLDPSCTAAGTGATSLINTMLAFAIRTGAHPALVACVPGGASGALPAPIGDQLILDPTEQTTISTRVDAYNTYISNKAASIGFAYWDPNPTLVALKTAGVLIKYTGWSATNNFGTGMSLDGVHPGALVQKQIANELIPVINTKYGTTLQAVP